MQVFIDGEYNTGVETGSVESNLIGVQLPSPALKSYYFSYLFFKNNTSCDSVITLTSPITSESIR